VIKSWNSKGLENLYENGSTKGVHQEHKDKILRILDKLDSSTSPDDMRLPAFGLHKLKGKRSAVWSVKVNGNWRITFEFDGQDMINVNYEDYH